MSSDQAPLRHGPLPEPIDMVDALAFEWAAVLVQRGAISSLTEDDLWVRHHTRWAQPLRWNLAWARDLLRTQARLLRSLDVPQDVPEYARINKLARDYEEARDKRRAAGKRLPPLWETLRELNAARLWTAGLWRCVEPLHKAAWFYLPFLHCAACLLDRGRLFSAFAGLQQRLAR